MEVSQSVYETLVSLLNDIMQMEDKAILTQDFADISNNDFHIIEAIGIGEPRSMSAVARDLSVTVGTLTIAINSLVKKSYVRRVRSEKDRRVVLISLLAKGVQAFAHHQRFHERLVAATVADLDEDQTRALVHGLENLRGFLLEMH